MKSLMLLCQSVLKNIGTLCCTSTDLDFKTVQERVETRGLTFLTIELADFGKDFERGLELGTVAPTGSWVPFKGFKRRHSLPIFLGGLMGQVFDSESGVLLDTPNVEAIRCLRQFTLMWAKIELDCTEERVNAAMRSFIECEREVEVTADLLLQEDILSSTSGEESFLSKFSRVSKLLWCDVLQRVEEDVIYNQIVPRHSGGQTAERVLGNAKYYQSEWTTRLEKVFSSIEFLLPSPHGDDVRRLASCVSYLEPGAERPVRVTAVPKTQKTPRIIAIEPICMQYVQQGLMEKFYEYIETQGDNLGLNIVGFLSQEPNQLLAKEGSLHRELATLDLSEASDRVSNLLVTVLLDSERYPNLLEAVQACRSTRADVQGEVVNLSKFASMGSALTFPIEAMVFSTCVLIGFEEALNTRLTPRLCKQLKGRVRVYGDDIIVPVDIVPHVIRALQTFGFKVNDHKSFWNGYFRESCGRDYYAGEDVTVTRVRHPFPESLKDVTEIEGVISLRNQLYKAGLWEVAFDFMDNWISNFLSEECYPVVMESSPILGRVSALGYEIQKTSTKTQTPLVRGYVSKVKLPVNPVDGTEALFKWFLKRGDLPIADRDHLLRSGRPESSSIKLRWGSPF